MHLFVVFPMIIIMQFIYYSIAFWFIKRAAPRNEWQHILKRNWLPNSIGVGFSTGFGVWLAYQIAQWLGWFKYGHWQIPVSTPVLIAVNVVLFAAFLVSMKWLFPLQRTPR